MERKREGTLDTAAKSCRCLFPLLMRRSRSSLRARFSSLDLSFVIPLPRFDAIVSSFQSARWIRGLSGSARNCLCRWD